MSKNIVVGISDMAVHQSPAVLATYALGSCIGICIYDKTSKTGGLSHILLPKNTGNRNENVMKFADTAVPELVRRLEKAGVPRSRLTAKIVGGAQMFAVSNPNSAVGQIGERNIEAVKEALRSVNIRVIAEDTGKNYGRTIFLHLETGIVQVKTAFGKLSEL